jgi:hypothetical protein
MQTPVIRVMPTENIEVFDVVKITDFTDFTYSAYWIEIIATVSNSLAYKQNAISVLLDT